MQKPQSNLYTYRLTYRLTYPHISLYYHIIQYWIGLYEMGFKAFLICPYIQLLSLFFSLLADLGTNSSEIQQQTITRTRHKKNTHIVNTAQVKSTSQIFTSQTKQLHEEDAEESNKSAPQRMMCVSDRKLLAAYFKRARNDPQVRVLHLGVCGRLWRLF